jgi:hypothetical protein
MTPKTPDPGDVAVLPGPPRRTVAAEGVTVDDIKRRAERIRSLAVDGMKQKAEETMQQRSTTIVVGAVAVLVVGVSLAYFMGRSTARKLAEPWCPPGCKPAGRP